MASTTVDWVWQLNSWESPKGSVVSFDDIGVPVLLGIEELACIDYSLQLLFNVSVLCVSISRDIWDEGYWLAIV